MDKLGCDGCKHEQRPGIAWPCVECVRNHATAHTGKMDHYTPMEGLEGWIPGKEPILVGAY